MKKDIFLFVGGLLVIVLALTVKGATLTLRPNANGTNTGLTKSSGTSNFEMVDETGAGDGDGTYVWTTAGGGYAIDTYNIPNSTDLGTINNVTVWIRSKKEDVMDPASSARLEIRSGGNIYHGGILVLTTSYVTKSQNYTNDPDTGSTWNWTSINNLEIGVGMVVTIGLFQARTTQVWTVVDYTVTDSCSCPASGNWHIINGDECTLATTCNIGSNAFRVLDGKMSILSGGTIKSTGCFVKDNESLYVDDSGGLFCG